MRLDQHLIGIKVHCTICHQQKQPRGRSASPLIYFCNHDCPGYLQDPQVGDLWPGESEADFGHPVRTAGTKRIPPQRTNMTYRVEVQADMTGSWATNSLTFDTPGEATVYALDLYARWTSVRAWRVVDERGVVIVPLKEDI